MEISRYLVAALLSFTLIMSIVSTVNPTNFAGLNAFADDEDERVEDSSPSTRSDDEDEVEDEDVAKNGTDLHDENELVQALGKHSKVLLDVDEAELEVVVRDGDLDDGIHAIEFMCDRPDVKREFPDSLNVTKGHGEFDGDLGLSNSTYAGCEVDVGGISAAFPTFSVIQNAHEDEDKQEGREHKTEKQKDDVNSSIWSNRHDDRNKEGDDKNSGTGSHSSDNTKDMRKERMERLVSAIRGADIHERHRNAYPHSPGEYDPGGNYTLAVNGTAGLATEDDSLMQEENVTVNLNMSVWKSNRAIILLDVIDGTVEHKDQDYEVRIGYALYSVQHDMIKVAALATDDDGNVYRLKLRGHAVDEAGTFPMESGSIDLILGGHFKDLNLLLEGTVEAN